MTLREAWNRLVDSYNDAISWFSDGFENLVRGNFFELTIGQTLVVLILSWGIIVVIRNVIRILIREVIIEFKRSGDKDNKS